MFQNIFAILFILKLVKRSKFYAPRFIQNHYGTGSSKKVREASLQNRKKMQLIIE